METIEHKNGKQVIKQYFGNLQEKLDTCRGYCNMYNGMVQKKNDEAGYPKHPMIDVDGALKSIRKSHDKFYGNQSKYDGKGNLK